jgi:hypothetical protein
MSYDPMTRLGRMSRCVASARVTAIMNDRFVTSDVPAKVSA